MKDGYCKTSSEALITVLNHTQAKGSAQLVLLRVANHVNKDYGYAWPGLTTLAHETGYSRKHVMDVLQNLEEKKELHIDRQTGRSNHYYIPVAPTSPLQVTSHLDDTSTPEVTGGVTCTALGESPTRHPNHLNNQLTNIRTGESASNQVRQEPIAREEKRPIPLPPSRRRHTPILTDPRFERLWALYPKKRSKGEAEKAWHELKPDDALVENILFKVAQAMKSPDWQKDGGQYIPYPATWLRRKGWEDDYGPVKEKRGLVL